MSKKQYTWPSIAAELNASGLATEAKQDAQIVIAEDTLTELEALHTDNTAENAAQLAELQDFHTDNTAENAAQLAEIQDFHTDNSAENAAALAELQSIETNTAAALTDAQLRASPVPVSVSGVATEAKQDAEIAALTDFAEKTAAGLVPEQHDYLELTYVAAGNGQGEIETVTYKLGGSGGTTQAVLTLAYDSNNKLSSVTKV